MSDSATSTKALRRSERVELGAMAGTIVALHVVGIVLLVAASRHQSHVASFGIGTGILAYTLGMRHAFDPDHLAAIDNTTRKLAGDGGRPLSVGFFFSLGHSSIVLGLCLGLGLGIRSLGRAITLPTSTLHQVTSVVGTSVSGAFLLTIGAINTVALVGILRIVRSLRRGTFDDADLDDALARRGVLSRLLGPVAKRVDVPWKMYPVGLLFGLGFDTATEVGLLLLAGTAVASGLPLSAVIALPLLFTAGMCLLDTADGCFMNFAYGWAFANPARKLYYNLTMTALSVLVAVGIGTVELLSLLATELDLNGAPWSWFASASTTAVGIVVVAAFILTWTVALVVWRVRGLETAWRVDERHAVSERGDVLAP